MTAPQRRPYSQFILSNVLIYVNPGFRRRRQVENDMLLLFISRGKKHSCFCLLRHLIVEYGKSEMSESMSSIPSIQLSPMDLYLSCHVCIEKAKVNR